MGVVRDQPRFICAMANLPSGAAAGDAIAVDTTVYTVRVILLEGTNDITLVLVMD